MSPKLEPSHVGAFDCARRRSRTRPGLEHVTLFGAFIYWAPTIAAICRGKDNWFSTLLVNTVLGWTVIGWLVAAFMAVSKPTKVIIRRGK